MIDTKLEDLVVAFITERGGGVSFVELERAFPDEFDGQEYAMSLTGYDNLMLWQPISQEMAEALNASVNKGRLEMNATQPIVYAIDGKVFRMPIAKKAHQYKTPHWLPVAFSPGKSPITKKSPDAITWLDDPMKYAYLRKGSFTASARFPIKRFEKQGDRVIGYSRMPPRNPYVYDYTIYWLKKHDRDLDPEGVYRGPAEFGGFMPSEAVNPRDLV